MNEVLAVLLIAPLAILFLGLLIWSLVWAFNDAEKRGKNGWLVVLLLFLMNWPISLLMWLVFRPEGKLDQA